MCCMYIYKIKNKSFYNFFILFIVMKHYYYFVYFMINLNKLICFFFLSWVILIKFFWILRRQQWLLFWRLYRFKIIKLRCCWNLLFHLWNLLCFLRFLRFLLIWRWQHQLLRVFLLSLIRFFLRQLLRLLWQRSQRDRILWIFRLIWQFWLLRFLHNRRRKIIKRFRQ